MKLKLLAAALLAGVAFSASAADQTIGITAGVTKHFEGVSLPGDGLLSMGEDVLTFNGLGAGWYKVVLTYSGNDVDITSASLNGDTPVLLAHDTEASLGKFKIASTTSPFILTLTGTTGASPFYSGQITVTAVPEPATYGMMLGGLGLLGYAARRKSKKQS